MRKEVLIAIIVGGVLGLAVAFGIWRANQALAPRTPQESIVPSPPVGQDLVITEPEDNLVTSETKIKVVGSFQAGATVAILYNLGEVILETEADGSFEQEIELEAGANEIKVVGFGEDGESIEKTLTVVYSSEFK